MRLPFNIRDTIAKRLCAAIMLAVIVTAGLNLLLALFSSSLARPPLERTGLLEQAAAIFRLVDAAPPSIRRKLVEATVSADYRTDWYDTASPVAIMLSVAPKVDDTVSDLMAEALGKPDRRIILFKSENSRAGTTGLTYDRVLHPDARFMGIMLEDGSWLVFTSLQRSWGVPRGPRIAIVVTTLILSTILVSAITAKQLAAPMKRFAEAARRFGSDARAPAVPETGPLEFKTAIAAFNAMQAQIARFVDDRTEMLAAISHDLRTPLTRMRLRGEFIEDQEQQSKLFEDVDEMQTMVDEALAFFKGNAVEEQSTNFDLAELLRTIIDDFADRGHEVGYAGPDHLVYRGRPFALKRAFTNLIDNAVRYASTPSVTLNRGPEGVVVRVDDEGHGIPADQLKQVFMPFFRLEPSRNRSTGGYGLGLGAARTIIRSHGGDIELRNRETGGLSAISTLP